MKTNCEQPSNEPPTTENLALLIDRAPSARPRDLATTLADVMKVSLMHIRPFAGILLNFFHPQQLRSGGSNEPQSTSERWIRPKMPFVLPAPQGQTIHCLAGTVWITQGDGNDYLLKAGETLTLHPVDTVVISAMASPALIRDGSQHLNQLLLPETEQIMNALTSRERELVALGATMGSNCQPCVEFHIPAARETGLSDAQISEAIRIADKVRRVPALKVLRAALSMLPNETVPVQASDNADRCCGMSTMCEAKSGCSA